MFEKIFGKKLSDGEFIELDTGSVETPSGKIPIKIDKLVDFIDTDRVQKAARGGSIVLVRIKELKERDLTELKRAIDKLRKTCIAMNGDIVGIDENYILLTPNFAHVVRE
ncbi:MAG: cell division protein SepF [Candidatus Aenigmarchaeota archaeon]|nr:cell division protein SepF [Candidatus Aenigmarchaeota archaeon]